MLRMSTKEFCNSVAVDANYKKLKKLWPDTLQLKGTKHASRAYITKVEVCAFLRRGFICKQCASTCDGKWFQWYWVAPTEAVNLLRLARKNLADYKM